MALHSLAVPESLIAVLGGACVGLVWGWLVALLRGSGKRTRRNSFVLGVSTIPLGAWILVRVDWWALGFFLVATVVALTTCLAWRNQLRNRSSMTSHKEEDRHA